MGDVVLEGRTLEAVRDEAVDAGVFSEWLDDMRAALRAERDATVPCGTCTACCTSSQFVHVAPDEADALAHIPQSLRFPAPGLPKGHVVLGYDGQGHCPMLIDGACSIYEHRPRTCRTYDCRVFAATGIEPDDSQPSIAMRVRHWEFTVDDRARWDAVRAAVPAAGPAIERALRAVAAEAPRPDALTSSRRTTEEHRRMTVVVALPNRLDQELLNSLCRRFPELEIVSQPYLGRYSRSPAVDNVLDTDQRAVWSRAQVAIALDLPTDIGALAPDLRWLQATGAGIEHLEHVTLPDVCVITNAAGVASAPIAEFAIGRLLAVWKRLPEIDSLQAEHRWKPKFGRTVEGLTLGVIGLGAIGTAVAVRARAFGMRVIATRRSYVEGQQHDAVDELRGTDHFLDVLARCDAVVVCAPATPDTEDLFDAAAFAAMRPGALFCNVARGSLVDEPALIAALESGQLGAAILDVTRTEPLPADDPLWSAPNVFISPHCSAAMDRYTDKLFALFADNLERFTRGEPLRNVVDRAAGY